MISVNFLQGSIKAAVQENEPALISPKTKQQQENQRPQAS